MIRIKNKTVLGFVTTLFFSVSANCTLMLDVAPELSSINLHDTVNIQVSLSEISSPDGLVGIHLDFSFDESILILNSASAGDFFLNNSGSLWVDFDSSGLSMGDAVNTVSTSMATGPDVLGFDFFETNFIPSLLSGVLIDLEFTAIALGDANFSLNDVSFLDDLGNDVAFNSSLSGLTVELVPEPEAITLLGIGMVLMMSIRRNKK